MDTALIKIKNSDEFAIVDAEDYERVKSFVWWAESSNRDCKQRRIVRYVTVNGKQKRIRLAHVILGYAESDKKIRVKYLNQNTFDLKKSNLRISGTDDSASFTLCIYFKKDKEQRPSPWLVVSYLRKIRKEVFIGRYPSEQNAKRIVRYIEENNIPVSNEEEINLSRPIIRTWAIENGYIGRSDRYGYKIGDERTKHGFICIKTDKGWRPKHHLIWEEAGNILPENHCLLFKDGNKRNFDLENLEVRSSSELAQRRLLFKYPEELRPTVELVWQLKNEIKEQIPPKR